MKYIDFTIQSIVFLILIGSAFFNLVTAGNLLTAGMVGLYLALFMGPWQMVSSLLSIFFKTPFYKLKIYHFVLSSIYLVVFFSFSDFSLDTLHPFFLKVMFSLPLALAAFYYFITWKWVFKSDSTSRFLSHTNF